MNFRIIGATVYLLMATALTPMTASADHKMPRNLSANGPWKTNLQWVTGKASRGFKIDDRSRSLAVDQAGVPALIKAEEGLRA